MQAAGLARHSVHLEQASLLLAAAKALGLLPPPAAVTDPLQTGRVQMVNLLFAASELKTDLL